MYDMTFWSKNCDSEIPICPGVLITAYIIISHHTQAQIE